MAGEGVERRRTRYYNSYDHRLSRFFLVRWRVPGG